MRYVLISENGVISNESQNAIPSVCDAITDNDNDFINVDLPPAFGPVIRILFGFFLPITISFEIGLDK